MAFLVAVVSCSRQPDAGVAGRLRRGSYNAVMDDRQLQVYAELAVRVALNVQAGQRVMIIGASLANVGASLEAAPLARQIAAAAYRAGSPLVETVYGDETQLSMRFKYAPRDSFGQFSGWLPTVLRDHVEGGHAVLSISANDPDLLAGEPPDLVSAVLQATLREMRPFHEQVSRDDTNWAVVAAPSVGWAGKVFPGVPAADAVSRLWQAIARSCRLDTADPLAAWESHLGNLAARTKNLNEKKVLGAEVHRTRHQSDAWASRGAYLGQRPKREPSRNPVFGQSSNGRSLHNGP